MMQKPRVLFALGSDEWNGWINDFLQAPDIDLLVITLPGSYEAFVKIVLLECPDLVVVLSHHFTLYRDAVWASALKKQAGIPVVGHPIEIAELAYEKRLMAFKLSGENSVLTIPELSVDEAKRLIAEGVKVVAKRSDASEGEGFRVIEKVEDITEIAEMSKSGFILQRYMAGTEYSVNIYRVGNIVGILEPVEKGDTNSNGLHPCKRVRTCPPRKINAEVEDLLYEASEKIARSLNLAGIAELEFIIENEQPYFLEINPRISATMRMNCAACGMSMFIDLARKALKQTQTDLIKYSACRTSYERHVGQISGSTRKRLLQIKGAWVTSRLTLSAETISDLEDGIRNAENVLSQ